MKNNFKKLIFCCIFGFPFQSALAVWDETIVIKEYQEKRKAKSGMDVIRGWKQDLEKATAPQKKEIEAKIIYAISTGCGEGFETTYPGIEKDVAELKGILKDTSLSDNEKPTIQSIAQKAKDDGKGIIKNQAHEVFNAMKHEGQLHEMKQWGEEQKNLDKDFYFLWVPFGDRAELAVDSVFNPENRKNLGRFEVGKTTDTKRSVGVDVGIAPAPLPRNLGLSTPDFENTDDSSAPIPPPLPTTSPPSRSLTAPPLSSPQLINNEEFSGDGEKTKKNVEQLSKEMEALKTAIKPPLPPSKNRFADLEKDYPSIKKTYDEIEKNAENWGDVNEEGFTSAVKSAIPILEKGEVKKAFQGLEALLKSEKKIGEEEVTKAVSTLQEEATKEHERRKAEQKEVDEKLRKDKEEEEREKAEKKAKKLSSSSTTSSTSDSTGSPGTDLEGTGDPKKKKAAKPLEKPKDLTVIESSMQEIKRIMDDDSFKKASKVAKKGFYSQISIQMRKIKEILVKNGTIIKDAPEFHETIKGYQTETLLQESEEIKNLLKEIEKESGSPK